MPPKVTDLVQHPGAGGVLEVRNTTPCRAHNQELPNQIVNFRPMSEQLDEVSHKLLSANGPTGSARRKIEVFPTCQLPSTLTVAGFEQKKTIAFTINSVRCFEISRVTISATPTAKPASAQPSLLATSCAMRDKTLPAYGSPRAKEFLSPAILTPAKA